MAECGIRLYRFLISVFSSALNYTYRNHPKFSDRQALANSADPDQAVCIVWTHFSMVEPHSSSFRVITTNCLGVRIFWKFTVDCHFYSDYQVVGVVVTRDDERAMIRNRCNLIPHPVQDTKRKRNKNITDSMKYDTAQTESKEGSFLPSRLPPGIPKQSEQQVEDILKK